MSEPQSAKSKTDNIERLQQVIFHLHHADSTWVESVPVREVFQGRVIWEGPVEVFTLRNHPKAKRAYAWSHVAGKDDSDERFIAVLEIPPVESAETAVKVAIAAEVKGQVIMRWNRTILFDWFVIVLFLGVSITMVAKGGLSPLSAVFLGIACVGLFWMVWETLKGKSN